VLDRIAATVRAVRERGGTSLEDLAARSGVPIPALTALEQGRRGVTTTQLEDVAAALSLDAVALLNGHEVSRRAPSVFLRHQPMQDFDDRDADALDDAVEQGRSLAALHRLLGEPQPALQAGTFPLREPAAHRQDAPAQDGYLLAREVRRWLGNPADPIGDLRAIVEERFGIAVVVRRLESSRVTAVCVRAETAAAIVLEARDAQRAQNPLLGRVYLAHELCHALFDPSAGGLHIVIDVTLDRKAQAAEQRARAFAAEFLLPREGVRQMTDLPGQLLGPSAALDLIARVRNRFGTPHPIAANHLCNQGLIAVDLREELAARGSTFTERPPEMTLPETDAPSMFVTQLAGRAHGDGFITDSEARVILGLDHLAPLPWEAEL